MCAGNVVSKVQVFAPATDRRYLKRGRKIFNCFTIASVRDAKDWFQRTLLIIGFWEVPI